MAHLVIVRGLPGTGKSTFAKAAYPTYEHLETDKLFYVDGVYRFDPVRLGAYHGAVQAETRVILARGDNVVVANTFSRLWEMQPYLDMECRYTVFEMEPPVCEDDHNRWDFELLAKRNVHGVPESVIRNMAMRWERYENIYVVNGR